MALDLEGVLAAHSDCITDCRVDARGVRDGQMRYVVTFTCTEDAEPFDIDAGIHAAHRAHVAAVLREQIVAAQAEAWDEGHRLTRPHSDLCEPTCPNPYRVPSEESS